MTQSGILYIVATPIGNLADISERAKDVLGQVDLIAAEDTRHSKSLLSRIGVQTPLTSYHDFSDDSVAQRFVEKLLQGQSLALVSDAGTPLISDPGFKLVRLVREKGLTVVPIPGPSAVTAALSVAGLATDRFCFEGFLPSKQGSRELRLTELLTELRTVVLYESPHRIEALVASIEKVMGSDRQLFIGREITKKFEAHFLGRVTSALSWLQGNPDNQRGEFVVILAGCSEDELEQRKQAEALRIAGLLAKGLSLKSAVSIASEITGARKNLLYTAMIEGKD